MRQQTRDIFVTKATRRYFAGTAALLLATVVAVATPDLQTVYGQESASTPPTDPSQPAAAVGAVAPSKRVVDYNNPTLEDILDAWKEREEKVKSFKIVWDVTITAYIRMNEKMAFDQIVPPLETKQTSATVALQGDKLAFGYPTVQTSHHMHYHGLNWYRTNGKTTSSFYTPPNGSQALATIHSGARVRNLTEITITPFLALYRPLYQLTSSYTSMSSLESSRLPNGVACTRLPNGIDGVPTLQIASEVFRDVYTLQPKHGLAPTRIQRYARFGNAGEVLVAEVLMELSEHAIAGWIPQRWKFETFLGSTGRPIDQHDAVLVSASINAPIEESLFELNDLPAGTKIVVESAVGEESAYIVGENGKREPVGIDDRSEPRIRSSFDPATVSIFVNVALFVLLLGVWLLRRRERKIL